MFNKILSTLPYSPSAIDQLVFYSKRLKQEESLRRLGLVLVVLGMFVQIFASAIPPEKSLASSSNNIINGIDTRSDILRAWDASGSDIPAIYGKFGVTRQDIANLTSRPNVTITSNQHDFWSIGRHSLSGYGGINESYKNSEVRLNANGHHIYMRKLNAWGVVNYRAFKGHVASTGKQFWIIADCGNFTQLGKETPAKPRLQIRKSLVGNTWVVQPGQTFTYRVEYWNSQDDSLAEGVTLLDDVDAGYIERLNHTDIPMGGDGKMRKNIGDLASSDTSHVFDLTVRVRPDITSGTKICNIAYLSASNASTVTSAKICVTVQRPATPIAPGSPTPPPPSKPPIIPPQPNVPPGSTKTVKNITRGLSGEKAIETKVRPGDVIEYTLTTTNGNDKEKTEYSIKDYIGDVLEYANLDTAFLASSGGTYDKTTKQAIWANQTLPAEGQVAKKLRVTIKEHIPTTNSPISASTTYDCKISNEYGDEISLKVQCPAVKSVEQLPNTGPGTSVAIAFVITVVSSYFFARTRLLSKEVEIVKKDYSHSGA